MLLGILFKVLSAFAFTLMSATVKLEGGSFPIGEIVFFRSLFALPVLLGWLLWRGEFPHALATTRPFGHIGRGLAGTIGMFCGFASVSILPLPEATAISYATPLLVVALAAILLGERVRLYRWTAVGVGFLGVLVMVSDHVADAIGPDAGSATGIGFALTAATFAAVAVIQTRRLTQSEETGAIVFYFTATTTVAGLLTFVLGLVWPTEGALSLVAQPWTLPSVNASLALVSVGLFGGVGQILLTQCYRYADASIVAAFDYTTMLWASSIGYVVFGEASSNAILAGAVIVALAGLFVIWREWQLGLIRPALSKSASSQLV